ncbi:MAG: CRISPR-associated protein, Csh1 family [uncultured Sulfurovum sp.]|uniref:CRISPR-associated protein, Csh1 family n=1 Tax=uncultured Sulfurovum sp. TaxID=269237 RepID=A0A6S6SU46_9BACT|nr:MAG: CRISPR-associated protein, Csh1 family [uncultured Sulfurovum sp.]
MGDIIKTLSKIGSHYLEDEKRVKNKAYEYDIVKVYLFDIETKRIEPSLNIKKEDLIITRFGVGANSGNLFPNIFFKNKDVNLNFDKFTKAILKANKNILSYFSQEEIFGDKKLQLIYGIENHNFRNLMNLKYSVEIFKLTLEDYDYHFDTFCKESNSFFDNVKEDIQNLQEHKKSTGEKGKVTTYFALSYQGQPISAHFKNIYDKHLNTYSEASMRGYDIVSNTEGIGGDANLAFCSTNELPTKLKPIKLKLLPLSFESAKKVKIGFDVMDKMLSHNFYGLKMAIMPTLLSDEVKYKKILEILERVSKGDIEKIEKSEYLINRYLEKIALDEKELPVLNTILFYAKNNSAVDVFLQIDDVLPSYISYISDKMGEYNVKAFKNKDEKSPNEDTIYLHNLFTDRLDIMNILLSSAKMDKDILIHKFSQLIYWGTMNKSYAHPIEWSKYFNGYYSGRSIESINRYLALFSETKKLKTNFILQKEINLEEIKSEKQKIEKLIEGSDFIDNEVLKSAYLLGMLSSALMNWQYGVSGSSSYEKWLNNSGAITKDSLNRIWKKSEETIRKLNSTSGSGNRVINEIKDLVIESSQKAFIYDGIVKSSFVSLSFAMGGSNYTKYIKKTKKEEK